MTRRLHTMACKRLVAAALLGAAALLTGCATRPMGAPIASLAGIQAAKSSGAQPLALGKFVPAPGLPRAADTRVSLRAVTLTSAYKDSFASQLRESLAVDLRAAGLLDPASPLRVEGFLTENTVDTSVSQGSGALGARFLVLRGKTPVYDKTLRVASTWESSLIGALAIPAAMNEYTALYRKLVAALFDDPAFRAATAR